MGAYTLNIRAILPPFVVILLLVHAAPMSAQETRVVAGGKHTCYQLGGRVTCWGKGDWGQTGRNTNTVYGTKPTDMSKLKYIEFPDEESVIHTAASLRHTCSIFGNLFIRCWGSNDAGRIGRDISELSNIGDTIGEMANDGKNGYITKFPSSASASDLCTGLDFTCGAFPGFGVQCWGDNSAGELGKGDTVQVGTATQKLLDNVQVVPLNTTYEIQSVRCGISHACALDDGNQLFCWGGNKFGQLGTGDYASLGNDPSEVENISPYAFTDATTILDYSLGQGHTCVVFKSGSIRCWGDGFGGALGTNSATVIIDDVHTLPPITFATTHLATQVVTGANTTCALFSNGGVRCWGEAAGRLGYGNSKNIGDMPGHMNTLGFIPFGKTEPVVQVSLIFDTLCVRFVSDRIICLGDNSDGQLGIGSTTYQGNVPGQVNALPYIQVGTPALTGIFPTAIPSGRAVSVALLTTPYIPVDDNFAGISFHFGINGTTPGTYVSYSKYTTTSPVFTGDGTVDVDLSLDGGGTTNRPKTIFVYPEPVVTAITPRSGSVHGGTNITVVGTGFITHDTVTPMCCIGSHAMVNAYFHDSLMWAWCVVPDSLNASALADTDVNIALALNGQDCSLSSRPFYLYDETQWSYGTFSPASGPVSGDTVVSLNITNAKRFGDPVLIRLGTDPIIMTAPITATQQGDTLSATWVTSFALPPPMIPPLLAGATVSVTTNGLDFHQTSWTFMGYTTGGLASSDPSTCIEQGNSLFYFTGQGIPDTGELTVMFMGPDGRNQTAAAGYNSGTEVYVYTPSFPYAGTGSMLLSPNGQQYFPQKVSFTVYNVTSIYPAAGPTEDSTFVTIYGVGFKDTGPQLSCKFGTYVDVAYFTSPISLRCIAPQLPDSMNGTMFTEVSVNGDDYTSDNQTFHYYARPTYTSLTPTHAPASTSNGSHVLTITGSGFLTQYGLYCRFGIDGTVVQARLSESNGTQVVCEVPTASEGQSGVEMWITLNNDHYHPSGLIFTYYTVLELSPPLGPLSGGTKVAVSGMGFPTHGGSFYCRFGTLVVAAVVSTSATVRCQAPLQLATGHYVVDVSEDNVHYTNNSVSYLYYTDPVIASIKPNSGPSVGGTHVVVSGTGVAVIDSKRIRCRFGLVSGSVVYDNATVICQSPSNGFGVVDLFLSLNGGADYTVANAASRYSYYTLSAIEPVVGPTSGGTLMQVSGTNFKSAFFTAGLAFCSFGGLLVKAQRISDSALTCNAPARGAGQVDFRITLNGNSYTGVVPYTYYNVPRPSQHLPIAGPADGNTVISITGTDFNTASPVVVCRFGPVVTPAAQVLTSTLMICTTPAYESKVTLSISFNNVDFTEVGSYDFFTINKLDPPLGPIEGGTVIRISGSGLVSAPSTAHLASCKFGDVVMNATIESALAISCQAPNTSFVGSSGARLLSRGYSTSGGDRRLLSSSLALMSASHAIPVQVSMDGKHFSNLNSKHSLSFAYYRNPNVTAISPNHGSTVGGTIVTLHGTGFINEPLLSCRFGDTNLDTPVSATYHNDTQVTCTTPDHAIGNVTLFVAGNRQQFIPYQPYSYDSCGFGSYAVVHTDPCTPCAPGTYSNEFGARECKLCDTATYMPSPGATECIACPTGSVALTTGSTDITNCTCPAGWYSEQLARGTVCKVCPEGATCAGGTESPVTVAGYWASPDTSFVYIQCAVAEACLGGNTSDCGTGYEGRLCGDCVDDYYSSGDACKKCPDNAYIMLIVLISLVVVLTLLLIKSVDPENSYQYGGTLAIMVDFFQILALLSNLPISWPPELTSVLKYIGSIFSFQIDIFQIECTLPSFGWVQKWMITMLLPAVMALVMLFVYIGGYVMYRINLMRGRQPVDDGPWGGDNKATPDMGALGDRLINTFCFIISIVYLIVIQATFAYFACTRLPDGLSSLNAQPSLLCYDDWWYQYLPLAILSLVVYGALIPGVFAWWVYSHAISLRDPLFNRRYSALYFEYRYQYSYWGTAIMVEKMAIAAVEAFCSNYSNLTLVLLLFVLFSILAIGHALRPFLEVRNNLLELIVRWCMCVLLLSGMVWDAAQFQSTGAKLMMSVVFLSIIALCIIIAVGMVALEMWNIRQATRQHLDKDLETTMKPVTCPLGRATISDWYIHLKDPSMGEELEQVLASIREHSVFLNSHMFSVNERIARELPGFVHVADNYTSFIFSPHKLPALSHWLLVHLQYASCCPAGDQSTEHIATLPSCGSYLREYADAGGDLIGEGEDPIHLLHLFFRVFSHLAFFQSDAEERESRKLIPPFLLSQEQRDHKYGDGVLDDDDDDDEGIHQDVDVLMSELGSGDNSDDLGSTAGLTTGGARGKLSRPLRMATLGPHQESKVHSDLVTILCAVYGLDQGYGRTLAQKLLCARASKTRQQRALDMLNHGLFDLANQPELNADIVWASLVGEDAPSSSDAASSDIGSDSDGKWNKI